MVLVILMRCNCSLCALQLSVLSPSSVNARFLPHCREFGVRKARTIQYVWLAYCRIQLDAEGQPGIFWHTASGILSTGTCSILSWHIKQYGSMTTGMQTQTLWYRVDQSGCCLEQMGEGKLH